MTIINFQIEQLEFDSESANVKAQTANDHIDQAKKQLETIKTLVKDLTDRNLEDLVGQLSTDRRTLEIADDLTVTIFYLIIYDLTWS